MTAPAPRFSRPIQSMTGHEEPPVPPMITRKASLQPSSFDPASNTVEAVLSTGAGVTRRDASGRYIEKLSLDPAHVDLASLTGAALLNSHDQTNLSSVLGVVERAWIEDGKLIGKIKLSDRPEIAGIVADVRSGVIRGVSLGYLVSRWKESTDAQGNRVRTAVAWTPRECSLVAVPADLHATIRSNQTMEAETITDDPPASVDRTPINQAIRTRGAAAGLSRIAIDGMIDRGLSVADASAEILDHMTRSAPIVRTQRVEQVTHLDAPEQLVTRMSEALAHRVTSAEKLSDEATPFRGLRLLDQIRLILDSRGVPGTRFMSGDQLMTRAIATADLPNLLESTFRRVLYPAYELALAPCKALAVAETHPDFRPTHGIRFSTNGGLQLMPEGGELQNIGVLENLATSYSLSTYGGRIDATREAIINDDLNALLRIPALMGRRAAELENAMIAVLITSNQAMEDGYDLFSTQHANVAATPSALSVASLTLARQAMRFQTDLDGVTPIAVVPKYLLVGPQLETDAEQLLATLYPRMPDEANPFSTKLQLLVEPRITGYEWFVFADPALTPCLEYAHLASQPGPVIQQDPHWNTLGMSFRVYLDFATTARDWRGAYMNPGVAPS